MPSGGTQPSLPPPPQIKHVWGRALLTLSSHSAAPHHHQPRGNTNSAVGGHSVGTEPSPTPGTDGDGALAAQSGDVWCHSADGKGWVWGNRSECQHQHCAQRSAGTTPKREGNPPCWDSAHIPHPSGSYWSIPIASLCCVTLRHRLHAVPSAVQGKSPLWSTAQPGSGGHAALSSSELWAMGPRPPPLISNPRPLHTHSIWCHQAETSAPPRRNWSSAQH